MATQLSFHEYRMQVGRGGPRKGAGRKRSGRRCDPKRAREKFDRLTAVHVTLRVSDEVRSLRSRAFIAEIRTSLLALKERVNFRLLHYSFQSDHVHLIVEAENHEALGRGMKAVSCRIARAAHRVFEISGKVLRGPYHAHLLRSAAEAHRAIAYVLLNIRKHMSQKHRQAPFVKIDEASSARWFEGFSRQLPAQRAGECEVSRPRSWLLSKGWRRYGSIDPALIPGAA